MFETKLGRAQWEIVTDVLNTKNIGDIATDEEFLAALGPDFSARSLSAVVWNAIRKFRDNKRTFTRVRKVGWRMVAASEHFGLARKQQIRSGRRLNDAKSIAGSADLSQLDIDGRRAIQAQFLHLSLLHDQVSRRVDHLDRRVGVVEKVQLTTDEEVDKLKNLLRRHGITDDE